MKFYLSLFCIFFSSCVYSFRGSLPSNIKTIYIADFADKKTEGRSLAPEFTDLVNQAFINDNTLLSVSKDKADLQLRGAIESVSRTTTKVDLSNQASASSYKLTVTVSIDCKNMILKKTLVKTTISRDSQIDASASEDDIEAKIKALLDEIKDTIVDRVIGAW